MAKLLTTIGNGGVLREMYEDEDDLEGFDMGVLKRTVRATSTAQARGMINLGANPPISVGAYNAMFCVHRRARKLVCNVYETEHTFRGIISLGNKPFKTRARGYIEKQSTEAGVYPGQTTGVPLESNQPLVGITVFYPALALPDLTQSGVNQVPPVSASAPTNIWSFITNPTHTYPFGWVLDAREYENIPGTSVVLVTDQYVFYHRFKP
jgi:hypothetical protein